MSFLKEQVKVITEKMEDVDLQLARLTFMEDQWEHFMNQHWVPFQVALSSLHSPPCAKCLYGVPALSPVPLSSSLSHQSEVAIPIPPPGRQPVRKMDIFATFSTSFPSPHS